MPASPRVLRRVAVLVGLAVLMSGCVRADLDYLASDVSDGRNNDTVGSVRAQNYLLGYLAASTVGANPAASGHDAYKQVFTGGTNVIGVLPGTDLADQYVMIGAHYDHLGHTCRDVRAGDDICNGATDNAAGVTAVLAVVRALGYAPNTRAARSSSRSGTARRTACVGSRTTRRIR